MPEEMAKLFVHFRSAAIRQNASTPAASAEGGSKDGQYECQPSVFLALPPQLGALAETNPNHHLDVIPI